MIRSEKIWEAVHGFKDDVQRGMSKLGGTTVASRRTSH